MTQIRSPLRAFVRSPLRARATNPIGRFIFQFLRCNVYAHNTDETPWGNFGGQDATVWPNAMDASFFNPSSMAGFGAIEETWHAAIHPFPEPNNPFLERFAAPAFVNPVFWPPAIKKGFGWQTGFVISGPRIWTILVCYRANLHYKPFTAFNGRSFPGGQWEEIAMRMKIFPPASGTLTKHSMDIRTIGFLPSLEVSNGFQSPRSIPPPKTSPVFRAAGDPMQEFFPDEPALTNLQFGPGGLDDPNTDYGTLELALFWLERKPSDLPAFPYLLDPSAL